MQRFGVAEKGVPTWDGDQSNLGIRRSQVPAASQPISGLPLWWVDDEFIGVIDRLLPGIRATCIGDQRIAGHARFLGGRMLAAAEKIAVGEMSYRPSEHQVLVRMIQKSSNTAASEAIRRVGFVASHAH